MEAVIATQRTLMQDVATCERNFRKTSKSRHTSGYLNGRMELLEDIWSTYRKNHLEAISRYSKDEEAQVQSLRSEYDLMEEYYCNLKGEFKELLLNLHKVETPTDKTQVVATRDVKQDFRLPSIDIPQFNGSYESWSSFKDLFGSLVHDNANLSKVQKLHYLKANVSGDAAQMLRHLSIISSNYDVAWKALVDRFDNKRMLVDAQLSRLMSLNKVMKESSQGLRNLLDTTNETLAALKNLGIKTEHWDPLIIYITVRKLPSETCKLWESKHEDSKDLQTFQQLHDFLEGRYHTLQRISAIDKPKNTSNENPHKGTIKSFNGTIAATCAVCQQGHTVRQCPTFLQLEPVNRRKQAESKGLCLNCLSNKHKTKQCASHSKCYICGTKHHTLLHSAYFTHENSSHQTGAPNSKSFKGNTNSKGSETKGSETHQDQVTSLCTTKRTNQILLATALVKVSASDGTARTFRALIDQGSQASFITEAAAQLLHLPRGHKTTEISGLNNNKAAKARGSITLNLQPLKGGEEALTASLLVIPSITNLLPSDKVSLSHLSHFSDLELADPSYGVPGKIDMLLGADLYPSLLLEGFRKGPAGSPLAQKTIFGWILTGPSDTQKPSEIISLHCRDDLESVLRKFWEIEELNPERVYTHEEKICEKIFTATTRKDKHEGRYIVNLPFKNEKGIPTSLGRSRYLALKRLQGLERKFQGNPKLRDEYSASMQEYLELGHMIETKSTEESHRQQSNDGTYYTCSYLPHHAVIKESSLTTKLRVVFDASSKSSTGISLNDELLVGPTIQDDLYQILLRWRTHKIALTADIAKMYRQIKVKEEHAEYQRILWRFSPDEKVKDYKLVTVTFGTAAAPFLAIRTLQQLAEDEAESCPLASKVTKRDFYVDDLMTGTDDISQARELQVQLTNLTASGGFELRKWVSNHPQALHGIQILDNQQSIVINPDETVKALGILWNPHRDIFHFTVSLPACHEHWTKRSILSDIARLFDPLGWLAPVIIKSKMFMQALWSQGLTWDEEVPLKLAETWMKYRNDLTNLEEICVPRWLQTNKSINIELHGFCDASEEAYAAAIYVKTTTASRTTVTLLTAKTRVKPIKEISLPRLELCGAVLLARLMHRVTKSLELNISSIHAWTDSTIVLAWLKGPPNRWKPFVANRVSETIDALPPHMWRHIASEDNPADCASRGITATELRTHGLWWHGPRWLKEPIENWPTKTGLDDIEPIEERKRVKTFVALHKTEALPLSRYSSILKLTRVVAYLLRFKKNCKLRAAKMERATGWLRVQEMQKALQLILQSAQGEMFPEEKHCLEKKRSMSSKSRILSLTPFLYEDGLIRVCGRLKEANLSFNERHPVILSSKHVITKLLMQQAHTATLHGGPQLMLTYLRKRYWIIDARKALQQIQHQCLICYKQKPKVSAQLMGQLPAPRVKMTRPFTHVGVDYAGPTDLRVSKGRGTKSYKGYIALFICLCTKGIHLEAVSDLTSEAFLAAFRRFVARRGLPNHMYSDCGTNFVGAYKKIKNDILEVRMNTKIAELLANDGVEWHFNPPASPHFGGLWEAGVKSTKYHLRRIVGETKLTFEEMSTVLCQIEACLNSRPLCPMTSDPDDFSVLTPGHFQIGTAPVSLPEPDLTTEKIHSLTRWRLLQNLQQHFWTKWSNEYLTRLQQRPKWQTIEPNIKKGTLVLIKDEKLPSCKWNLGRVEELHPGRDGLTRVVVLKTAHGHLKRPITKICALPNSKETDDSNASTTGAQESTAPGN